MTSASFSRGKLVREASLTQADMNEVAKCRREHNRLGFAYQIGFARLFNRFPAQQPLEINNELLSFDISLLEHVSPIEWENVILYGQYVLNPDDIR